MKLTAAQIDRLYEFTRQHYVEWYDLQTELVDHLANAIEAQWQENPKLDFEAALNNEFKKFGVFGFMDVIEKRQAALNKRYNNLIWMHFKTFFKIPQVFGVILSTLLFAQTLRFIYFDGIFSTLLLTGMTFSSVYAIKSTYQINRKKKENKKRWLFEEILNSYGSMSAFMSLPFYVLNTFFRFRETVLEKPIVLYILSLGIVMYYLAVYIVIKIIPAKAKEYLNETYPEYSLVNE
jgi:hypothetical protein